MEDSKGRLVVALTVILLLLEHSSFAESLLFRNSLMHQVGITLLKSVAYHPELCPTLLQKLCSSNSILAFRLAQIFSYVEINNKPINIRRLGDSAYVTSILSYVYTSELQLDNIVLGMLSLGFLCMLLFDKLSLNNLKFRVNKNIIMDTSSVRKRCRNSINAPSHDAAALFHKLVAKLFTRLQGVAPQSSEEMAILWDTIIEVLMVGLRRAQQILPLSNYTLNLMILDVI
jgi:hypothetical protein